MKNLNIINKRPFDKNYPHHRKFGNDEIF